ncbi:unnamed protein product [Tetraodon nigroviridis]|uniref:(spotted green pufferfish) hypothetical protein n=1 Tax=Tetraodon nigroviridis TaxID=99883 RepID=Q4SC75_TETNG|nr:unnamed protein product [Tetraodon nigroviridis]
MQPGGSCATSCTIVLPQPRVPCADDSLLTLVEGAHLECVIKKHPALDPAMHLFPENVFISGDENIPGLMSSPTGDALLKPQLLKMLPFVLHRVTITLQPSLEMFESQLLRLINADYHNTLVVGPSNIRASQQLGAPVGQSPSHGDRLPTRVCLLRSYWPRNDGKLEDRWRSQRNTFFMQVRV